MNDLIWLQTGFIGDVVLTTAAIELAAREFPGVRQHLVTTAAGAAAIREHQALATCVVFDKSLRALPAVKHALQQAIAAPEKTVTIQVHRSYRSSFLARYLGFRTVTYAETSAGWLAQEHVTRVAVFHEVQRIALLLEPLGVERRAILAARPRLPALPLDSTVPWQRMLYEFPGRLVAIAPGSVWGTKRWTIEGFSELANRLLAYPDLGLVLLGSDQEQELTAAMARALKLGQERVFDLAGKTKLTDLRRIMPRLSLLIGNDSSPLHFASAFDVPTVAIFGATIPEMGFAPLASRSRTLGVTELACRPCSAHGPQVCPQRHFRCMRQLTVDSVFVACQELLA